MAGELAVYHEVQVVVDGKPEPVLRADPVKRATLTSGKSVLRKVVTIPASTSKEVWRYSDTGGHALVTIFNADGSGAILIAERFSPRTSTTDKTPTGSNVVWQPSAMSCVGVWQKDSDQGTIDSTPGSTVSESGGFPAVWTAGTRVAATRDRIAVRNEGTSAVNIIVQVVPE
jgi:hypothetical protein